MDQKLYKAAGKGDVSCLSGIDGRNITEEEAMRIQDGFFLKRTQHGNSNIVHIAARAGRAIFVAKALQCFPFLSDQVNSQGDTPLVVAARFGHLQVVKTLADPNNEHPMHDDTPSSKDSGTNSRSSRRQRDVEEGLIDDQLEHATAVENGTNSRDKATILENETNSSSSHRQKDAEEVLVDRQLIHGRTTALHEALRNRHKEVAQYLLKLDPEMAILVNGAGESPLFLAAESRCESFMLDILQSNRSYSTKGPDGLNVLHAAGGCSELGPISKTQNTQARESACEVILAQAVRHAPTLLNYEPSYKGVLKKKEKKKDGEPGEKGKRGKKSQPTAVAERKRKKAAAATEGPQPKRQKGVRLPKIGYTAAEWLSPLGPEELELQAALEMSRRNIPRPPIPTKGVGIAKGGGPSEKESQLREKRQKTLTDPVVASVSRPDPEVGSQALDPREKRQIENPDVDLTNPAVEAALLRKHFSPSYTMPDGRVVLFDDSVKEEPNLAVTMLRGLALPRDYDQVPTELVPGLAEMCSHLVQAGQAALKAYDKAERVQAERERFRTDRESYKAKWRASQQMVKEEEAEVERLKKELADSQAAAANAEAALQKFQLEEKEKMKVGDAKGYEAGIKRAALEYTRVAYKMVNEALEGRLPEFYRRGYTSGAHEMAGVMAIQAEPGFLRQLPEPVVPDLELPYTEEECAPLPPEDDDEDDQVEAEEGEKATEAEGQEEVAEIQDP